MECISFISAVNHVLKNEGGFVDHKKDPGGATNRGISLRLLNDIKEDINEDGKIDKKDIELMSKEDASKIYFKEFWEKYNYNEIDSHSIATKIFDMSVNMGPSRAHKILQKSLNRLGEKLKVDGILGPKTIKTLNEHSFNDATIFVLLNEIRIGATRFYVNLVASRPKLAVFKKGWIKRASL